MRRLSALEILRRIKPRLQGRYPLSRLALFGSTARDEAGEDSDIDVLVEVDPSIGLRFVDLAAEIQEALGRPADVVSRRAIDHARWAAMQPELADA
jgi:predicted nucleotidyltransferase